jgi:adenylate kinase
MQANPIIPAERGHAHEYHALLLIGLPGSGKSTQGKILAALPGIHYWKAGDVLRTIDPVSDIGHTVHRHISHGSLIPDELAVSLCLEDLQARVIAGAYQPAADLLALDGIPRTVRQASLLEPHIAVIVILYLACDDVEQVVQRLRQRAAQQGRVDDANERVIRHRLEVYQRDTAQVLKYYPAGRIAKIDAFRPPAEVFHQILHRVLPILNR